MVTVPDVDVTCTGPDDSATVVPSRTRYPLWPERVTITSPFELEARTRLLGRSVTIKLPVLPTATLSADSTTPILTTGSTLGNDGPGGEGSGIGATGLRAEQPSAPSASETTIQPERRAIRTYLEVEAVITIRRRWIGDAYGTVRTDRAEWLRA